MKSMAGLILMGLLMICQSCTTAKLWEDANPNERVWIDASKITEESLQQRGVAYEPYAFAKGKGYLVKKSGWDKMKDYHLRMLGTPVTLVVDAATSVVVVGAYVLVTDPELAFSVIEALSK
jgi:hypothetical protein